MVKAFRLAALLCLVPLALAAKPPLDYKDPPPDPPASGALSGVGPGTLPGRIPERLVGPGPYQRLPSIDESQWVVMAVRQTPYWSEGKLDPVLSNACQLGNFQTLELNRLIIRFTGKEGRGFLRVVPPTHRFLLQDRFNMQAAGETYYFRNSGFPDCQVWVGNRARKRAFDTRGTSLPKTDPKAKQKRLNEIRSWPD